MSAISGVGATPRIGQASPPDGNVPPWPRGRSDGTKDRDPGKAGVPGRQGLSPADDRRVQELAETDRKVRAHEAAHRAAAGSLGGAVTFRYETGPDHKSYAVGGEVAVSMSAGLNPDETIARAAQIRAAALAPPDPSPQDLAVAAEASQMEAEARAQKAAEARALLEASSRAKGAAIVLGTRPRTDEAQAQILARPASAEPDPSAGSTDGGPAAGLSASAAPVDVGDEQASTVALLQSQLPGRAQLQRVARLAAAAYRV